MIVKGWVAILQPILLSIGAAFTALNLDVDLLPDIQPLKWKKWHADTKEEAKARVKG